MNMEFVHPLYFLLLLLLIPMIAWYVWKHRQSQASLRISSADGFAKAPKTFRIYLRHLPFVCRIIAISLLIVALARPQSTDFWSTSTTEAIDIAMVLDISSSMLAQDLKPDRIRAAKKVAASFINSRPNDNIGLVLFSGESFTQCPLTTDHAVLLNLLNAAQCGIIEDGTAIGHGLATAVSRLKDSETKSKVIILLTDGTNNMGEIAPVTAAEIAQAYNIRVYTIGVGTRGEAPYPIQTPNGVRYQNMPVEIDEAVLTKIAQLTNGLYFRATNTAALENIYNEIDRLEKTKMQVQEFSKKTEGYWVFALLGFLVFLLEITARYTFLKNIP